MKRQIRFNVFETNSSSTHSISMCPEEEYNKWINNELFLNQRYSPKKIFITKSEALEILEQLNPDYDEDDLEHALYDIDIYTHEKYFDNDYLCSFKETYTTQKGETIVAFGLYGSDN